MDLDFKLNSRLGPSHHIEYMCCKALKMLKFVMRLDKDFRLGIFFKSLYCGFVHTILEYGVVV